MEASDTGPGTPRKRREGAAVAGPRGPRQQVVANLIATMEGLSGRPSAPAPLADTPEQKLRLLARLSEENPNVALRLDALGTVLYGNAAAAPFLAACGAQVGERLPPPWPELVREACEFRMVRSEEMAVGAAFYDVTFAPVPEAGCLNLYAVDITRRHRAEVAAREAGQRLLHSLEQTIEMLARAIEKRDPSTFGHQNRVARIAAAIAAEMGLECDRIEGLRLGATIHDIGKLHMPAELLTRPGKLRAIELELIRQHPLTGYEIVKDVAFPWPVAQMVLQHHERMDGSGYPNGLAGEAILLEARILAVADVVDGLSMHRPYRAALGPTAALQEIERMRGRWLDPQAVDACLRLVREKGFVLAA